MTETDLAIFEKFPKIPRLSREIVITEKIDGTNAQVCFTEDDRTLIGSRKRWITPEDDNHGFARWVMENEAELKEALGYGRHFGEWWGQGIQRRYGMERKCFSLFNTHRWQDLESDLVGVVPILYEGMFQEGEIYHALNGLESDGSKASPGFMNPEGVVIFHKASGHLFKKTVKNDEAPKGSKEIR